MDQKTCLHLNFKVFSKGKKIKCKTCKKEWLPKKKTIRPGGGRQKGHQFERDTAILFRSIFPGAKRHLENREDQCRGFDIDGTEPFFIQCKSFHDYAPLSRIQEIQIDPMVGGIPVLITKGDGLETLVAFPLSDFLSMLKKLYKKQ